MTLIVCMATCWSCKFGHCFEPAQWHTWADDEDIEAAMAAGLPDPSNKRCACSCAGGDQCE